MKPWLKCVVCIIIYRVVGSKLEVLLIKRKPNQVEGGKWGVVGGSGAFEESENPIDFALREITYDLTLKPDPDDLVYFTSLVSFHREEATVELYFALQTDLTREINITRNELAPEKAEWFSMDQIKQMAKEGKIAFDNAEILERFSAAL